MPQLTTYQQASRALTNFIIGYENQEFVGEALLTVQTVPTRTGDFWKYGKELYTPEPDLRAPKTPANEIEHEYSSDSFQCVEHALKEYVSWEERDDARKYGTPLEPYRDATELVTEKLALNREKEVANLVRSTASYASGNSTTLAGVAQWSDYTNSDPVVAVNGWKTIVRQKTGKRPKVMLLPDAVYQVLKYHPRILDKLTITNTKIVTAELLKVLFEVDELYIPEPIENTANPAQTPVLSDIWGKDVVLLHREPRPRRKQITFAKIFRLNIGVGDKKSAPGVARTWEDKEREADAVQVAFTEAKKIIAPEAGYLAKNAVA